MTNEVTLELPERYDLALVFGPLSRGRYDPTVRLDRRELWRAANTPDGPVTLHVAIERDRARARAWGPGAAWTLARVDALSGLRDDPAALVTEHPRVAAWQRAVPALRLTSGAGVHDVAMRTVIEQRVTGIEARRSWCALVRRFGRPAPGPSPDPSTRLLVPPAPDVAAALDDRSLRTLGLEARRGLALTRVAAESSRLERAAGAGCAVLDRALRALPGVGRWTSATVRELALGDCDAVPVGDWHIGRQVVFAFTGERGGDDERMLALLAPFAGQRGRVVRLALAAGAHLTRRAPRAEIADIARRDARRAPFRLRRSLRFT